MIPRLCAALLTLGCLAGRRLGGRCLVGRPAGSRRLDDRGQTTAEYALVLVGAAAVAVLLLTWATGSGRIGWLLDKMMDTVANMVN